MTENQQPIAVPERRFPGICQAILLLIGLEGLIIFIAVAVALVGVLLKTPLVEHPVMLGGINLVAFGAVIAVGAFFNRSPIRELFPLRPIQWSVLVSVLIACLGVNILLSEVDNLFRSVLPPPAWLAAIFEKLANNQNSFWGMFFTLAIVAPVTEEPLFRGLILNGFLSRYSVRTSIVCSSLFFGLAHMNPWQFVSAMALGLLLGWFFVRTGSLLPCLAGHAFCNSMVALSSLLPFKIRGFNADSPASRVVEFQPLWLDLLGLVLAVTAIGWFLRATRPPAAAAVPVTGEILS